MLWNAKDLMNFTCPTCGARADEATGTETHTTSIQSGESAETMYVNQSGQVYFTCDEGLTLTKQGDNEISLYWAEACPKREATQQELIIDRVMALVASEPEEIQAAVRYGLSRRL